jgi:enoyl-CoA hydratase/carnithine racemase
MALDSKKEGHIVTLTINRPEARNAFSPDLVRELHDAMVDFKEDPNLWVGIITAVGDRAFCAGADIKTWLPFVKESRDKPWIMPTTPMRGFELWKPLIAAVNGVALGGGLEIALACDIRIASENARFGSPEVSLGIMPRWGGTQRLPRILPWARAAELLFTGKIIDAQEACRIGLINEVVPLDQLMPKAKEWAEKICSMAPLAVRGVKEAMIRGMGMNLDEGLWLENALAFPLYDTEDYGEGRAAFVEKRKPAFKAK